MTETVCAAMSGGVDSSVAAFLLQQAGMNVFGATMKLYRPQNAEQDRDALRS